METSQTTTVEQKTAAAVLQKPTEVVIGSMTFNIPPPSIATLILVSEAVSKLPAEALDMDKVVEETLSVAKHCHPIGEIIAIFLLGAKRLKSPATETVKKQHSALFGLIKWETKSEVEYDPKAELSEFLLEELTPKEIYDLFAECLKLMQLQDFFGLTTFLTEINLLRPTKVVTEATAFGQ